MSAGPRRTAGGRVTFSEYGDVHTARGRFHNGDDQPSRALGPTHARAHDHTSDPARTQRPVSAALLSGRGLDPHPGERGAWPLPALGRPAGAALAAVRAGHRHHDGRLDAQPPEPAARHLPGPAERARRQPRAANRPGRGPAGAPRRLQPPRAPAAALRAAPVGHGPADLAADAVAEAPAVPPVPVAAASDARRP
jgi:hypothetical protein